MSRADDQAIVETLRNILVLQGMDFSPAEVAAGAVQLAGIRDALRQLTLLQIDSLEPTTYLFFQESRLGAG